MEINQKYILELSSVIENAPYMLNNEDKLRYNGNSKGNSNGNSHSSNSSSHSASRAEALLTQGDMYKIIVNLGNCNSQSKSGNSSSGSKSTGPSSCKSKGFSDNKELENLETKL